MKTAIGQRYGDTHAGRRRRRNEDAFVCDPPLFAVADGMGGAQAGELASSLAAAALRERSDRDAGGETRVVELIREANRRVHDRALHDVSVSGMGTTMTVALHEADGTVTIGHVGDSRAYVLRDGELLQLTEDHSLVAELVRRGELSQAEADVHPQRSVITRALGTDADVDVDAFPYASRPGDVFLLCSDGLTTMVDARTIAMLVERHRGNLRDAAQALIDAANDHGGEDNVTAVLFEVVEADEIDWPDTVEAPVVGAVADDVDPDEEETLHPEDRIAAPAAADGAEPEHDAGITAVASAAEVEAALAAAGRGRTAGEAAEGSGAAAALDPAADGGARPASADGAARAVEAGDGTIEPTAPLWRKALALLVIAGLVVLIAFLVMRGLAR